jgi:hypothetical protein
LLVPFELSCSGFPFLAVLSQLSLSWLSCSKCPFRAVLSLQCSADSPVLSVLSFFPVLVSLFWLPCSG